MRLLGWVFIFLLHRGDYFIFFTLVGFGEVVARVWFHGAGDGCDVLEGRLRQIVTEDVNAAFSWDLM